MCDHSGDEKRRHVVVAHEEPAEAHECRDAESQKGDFASYLEAVFPPPGTFGLDHGHRVPTLACEREDA